MILLLSFLGCATTPVVEIESPVEPMIALSPIPSTGELPSWDPPAPEVFELSNGSSVWFIEDHRLPMLSFRMLLDGGAIHDPVGQEGLSHMTATMMGESAGERSSIEMSEAASEMAVSLGSGTVTNTSLSFSMSCDPATLDRALELMSDMVMRPQFTQEDWVRVHNQQYLGALSDRENGASLSVEVGQSLWVEEGNPWGRSVSGTPSSLDNMTLAQVVNNYQRMISPHFAGYVVVGDTTREQITVALEQAFEGWDGPSELPDVPARTLSEPRMVFVDDPGSSQTSIFVLGEGPSIQNIERYAADMTGVVMGGSFTSRLNSLMREEKGYTYGARAGFSVTPGGGVFSAHSLVRGDATVEALNDLIGLLDGAALGFSPEERGKARAQVLAGAVDSAESRSGLASRFARRMKNGMSPGTWGRELELTMSVNAEEMQVIAERYFQPSGLLFSLAGDLATIGPMLDEAGFDYTVVAPAP
jgi:zinc protease